jgi:hypothetical protein
MAIPLEIRLLIYHFSLEDHKRDRTSALLSAGLTLGKIPGMRSEEEKYTPRKITGCNTRSEPIIINNDCSNNKLATIVSSPCRGFSALRMANQKISVETASLLYIPGIALTLSDDLAMKMCSDRKMLDFMNFEWVKNNLVTIQIQFLWENPSFPYRGDQLVKMYPSTTVILLRKLFYALGLAKGHWKEDWEFDFRPRNNLSCLAKVLDQCPKLKRVELEAHDENLFRLWANPVGDMIALEPLVRKGVEVQLMTGDGISSHLGHWRAFENMKSNWGIWAWLHLKLFSQGLRWKLERTEYTRIEANGGDGMKYSVLKIGPD